MYKRAFWNMKRNFQFSNAKLWFLIIVFVFFIYSSYGSRVFGNDLTNMGQREEVSFKCPLNNNNRIIISNITDRLKNPVLPVYEGNSIKDTLEKGISQGCDLSNLNLARERMNYLNNQNSVVNTKDCPDKNGEKLKFNRGNFHDAEIEYACLVNSEIQAGLLNRTIMIGTNLKNSKLGGSEWVKAKMTGVILQNTDLQSAILEEAFLNEAKISNANLRDANLEKANLTGADLSGSDLSKANLSNAILKNANLTGAILKGTKINHTDFSGANLTNVIFEPDIEPLFKLDDQYQIKEINVPIIKSFVTVIGLSTLKFETDTSALYILEKKLRESGLLKPARQVFSSIQRSTYRTNYIANTPLDYFKQFFIWLALDFTNSYGSEPIKPLGILLILILIFSLVYSYQLLNQFDKNSAIWIISQEPNKEREKFIRINGRLLFLSPFTSGFLGGIYNLVKKGFECINIRDISYPHKIAVSLYWGLSFSLISTFSIISTFTIALAEFEISDWIAILQPKYILFKSTGIVRMIAGIQSLFSAYLLMLWIIYTLGDILSF